MNKNTGFLSLWFIVFLVFLSTSCSNPLRKGERIEDFNSQKFLDISFLDLQERVEDDDGDHVAQYLLAEYYLEREEIPLAWYHVNEALKSEEFDNYFLMKAKVLFARKEFDEAKQLAKSLEVSGFKHIDNYKLLTEIYLTAQETDSSNHYISILKRTKKDLKEISYYNGVNYLNAGDTLSAVKEFYSTIAKWPNNLNAYQHLSSILLGLGDRINAYEVVKKGITQFPKNNELKVNQAMLIKQDGYIDSAVVLFRQIYAGNDRLLNVNFELGDYYLNKFKYDSALFFLEKSVGYAMDNVSLKIADVYFSQYKNDLALLYYEKALVYDKESPYIDKQISRCKWRINYRNNPNLQLQNQGSTDSTNSTTQKRDTIQ